MQENSPYLPPAGPPSTVWQSAQQDADHLRILSILHCVLGGIVAFFSCFGLIYAVIGVVALGGGLDGMSPQEAKLMGGMFLGIGLLVVFLGWTVGLCQILTGRWLARRRHHTFCFVIACIECLNMPLGTALGVFTIIVLQRPGVRALFG